VPKLKPHVYSLIEGVLNLVDIAATKLDRVYSVLESRCTRAHTSSGKRLPKKIVERIGEVYTKLDSAHVCLANSLDTNIDNPGLVPAAKKLVEMAKVVYRDVNSRGAFGRRVDIKVPLSQVLQKLRALKGEIDSVRVQLTPYTRSAAVTAVPTKKRIKCAEPAKLSSNDTHLDPILEKFRDRGWRIPDQVHKEKESFISVPDEDDEFLKSIDIIRGVQKVPRVLLSNETILGVTKFPVISFSRKRFPESVLRDCAEAGIGYVPHRVFGGYLVLENMYLLGIHSSIMRMQGDSGVIIDTDKFPQLLPYMTTEYPQWSSILRKTFPVQPTKRAAFHYYCPLLPKVILSKWGHGIGNWEFLNS